MATYIILGIPFLLCALVLWVLSGLKPSKSWAIVGIVLFILTAIFDSLIIHAKIVGYNYDFLIGTFIIKAPIEDFLYTMASLLLVPAIWHLLGRNKGKT